MTMLKSKSSEVAEQWGPARTKAFIDGDMTSFKSLFADKPIIVVLQNEEGSEAEFTIGDGDEATLSWQDFHESTSKDLAAQNYLKSESSCLGVLGDRVLLEVCRYNKEGEVYLESYSLLTLDEDGKVSAIESFTDPQVGSLMAAATSAE